MDGSVYQGLWDQDKMQGEKSKLIDVATGEVYIGAFDNGKKSGTGCLYDPVMDIIFEGEFQNDKMSGEGVVFQRDGKVYRATIREQKFEG